MGETFFLGKVCQWLQCLLKIEKKMSFSVLYNKLLSSVGYRWHMY